MTDWLKIGESLGVGGILGSISTFLLNRRYRDSRDRVSDASAFTSQVLQRLGTVENTLSATQRDLASALGQIADLSTRFAALSADKVRLETEVFEAHQEIGKLEAKIKYLQETDLMSQSEIASLREQLAAKKGEVKHLEQRIQAIQDDFESGKLTASTFFQKREDSGPGGQE